MTNNIKAEEEQYLNFVKSRLDDAKNLELAKYVQSNKDIDSLEDAWEDIKVKDGSYDGLVETAASIRQQQQMLLEKENAKNLSKTRLQTYNKQLKTPYFARLDIKDDKEGQESIYIGLSNFLDGDNFLIYDWRAPIASVYYDGQLGKASYESPDGVQTTNVLLKRQFDIKDGQLLDVFDTEEALGDHMLLKALSAESNVKMKSIVTTIQKEQNKIIRNTSADMLFVQGAAGSGKTAAILQRIAYLLYRYRGKVNSTKIVLLSPNQLFNDYINNVLPELGEQNMVQLTFYQYASRRLPRFTVETLNDRFNESNDDLSIKLNTFKGSLDLFDFVEKYAASLNQKNFQFKAIKVAGRVLFSKEDIENIYYSFNDNYNLYQRLNATQDLLIRKLTGRVGSEMREDWVQEKIDTLSKQEYDELLGTKIYFESDNEGIVEETRKSHGFTRGSNLEFNSEEEERKYLAKHIVMRAFRPIMKKIKKASFININAQFVHLLKTISKANALANFNLNAKLWNENVATTIAKLKEGQISLADTAIYLHLYDMIAGKKGQRDIRFLFIDEIQDYTPYQLAFLKRNFPKARVTALGDLNQAIYAEQKDIANDDVLEQIYQGQNCEKVILKQTYRSTKEITDFTIDVLGNTGQPIEAFERHGEKPVVHLAKEMETKNVLADILKLDEKAEYSTAIIVKDLEDLDNVDQILNDLDVAHNVISSENDRLSQGIVIIPSYLAKGLEFDSVIIWNASVNNYQKNRDAKLFYTVASRAMHRLNIIANKDNVTDILSGMDTKLFVKNEY